MAGNPGTPRLYRLRGSWKLTPGGRVSCEGCCQGCTVVDFLLPAAVGGALPASRGWAAAVAAAEAREAGWETCTARVAAALWMGMAGGRLGGWRKEVMICCNTS